MNSEMILVSCVLVVCALVAFVGVQLLSAQVSIARLSAPAVPMRAPWSVHAWKRLDLQMRSVLCGALIGALAAIVARQVRAVVFLAVIGGVVGYLLVQQHAQSRARRQEREIVEQLPVVIEMLALAVSAGEAPATALARVTEEGQGIVISTLRGAVSDLTLGSTLAQALQQVRHSLAHPDVDRFIEGIVAGQERGTPLVDVLHSQARDARERQRRGLIEKAASSEVAMMIPVVFLIMPVTIVFALFPSFYRMTWI